MDAAVSESLILARRTGAVTRITLNRPRAINALNIEMFGGIHAALDTVAGSTAIVLDGAGERGFCGGGDIKEIAFGNDPRELFRAEYRIDHRMSESPVPVVAIMDGIAMGGGIGLGGHAAFRIVTERSRLAMPEVRIGILPDVGGHLLLSRAPGRLGEYLAITAGEMGPADAIALGFADTLIDSARIDELQAALAAGGDPVEVIEGFAEEVPESPLLAVREWFDPIADAALGSLDAVVDPIGATVALLAGLESSGRSEAQETAKIARGMSPLSVVATVSQLARTRAARLDLAGVLEDDFRIASRLAEHPNFAEGVRAQLVDKDRNPQWQPARVEDLDPDEVAAILAPYAPGETGLGLTAANG